MYKHCSRDQLYAYSSPSTVKPMKIYKWDTDIIIWIFWITNINLRWQPVAFAGPQTPFVTLFCHRDPVTSPGIRYCVPHEDSLLLLAFAFFLHMSIFTSASLHPAVFYHTSFLFQCDGIGSCQQGPWLCGSAQLWNDHSKICFLLL